MIVEIIKITKELLSTPDGRSVLGYSYNLPLFNTNLVQAWQDEKSEYVFEIFSIIKVGETRLRYPALHYQLNVDEMNKINAYWNYAVENNKDVLEFEL